MGLVHETLICFQLLWGHSQLIQSLQGSVAGQKPQDHLFAKGHWNGRYPDICGTAFQDHLEPAVLGPSFLRNIQAALGLDPADHGLVHADREPVQGVQNPVYPETNRGIFPLGLNMNITRPFPESSLKKVVHRLDDMLLGITVPGLSYIHPALQGAQAGILVELHLRCLDRIPKLEKVLDKSLDLGPGTDIYRVGKVEHMFHVLPELRLEGVEDQ